jgi:hypothetical protein
VRDMTPVRRPESVAPGTEDAREEEAVADVDEWVGGCVE